MTGEHIVIRMLKRRWTQDLTAVGIAYIDLMSSEQPRMRQSIRTVLQETNGQHGVQAPLAQHSPMRLRIGRT